MKTASIKLIRTPISNETYDAAVKQCKDLAISRSQRYGNSIDVMRTPSIIDLILMKLVRTRELPETDPKYYDEIIDSVNYLVYILIRKNLMGASELVLNSTPYAAKAIEVLEQAQRLFAQWIVPDSAMTDQQLHSSLLELLDNAELVQMQSNADPDQLEIEFPTPRLRQEDPPFNIKPEEVAQ